MTQKELVIKYLQEGKTINKKIAITEFNIQHLGGVIAKLKDDLYLIDQEIRKDDKGRMMHYWLRKNEKEA